MWSRIFSRIVNNSKIFQTSIRRRYASATRAHPYDKYTPPEVIDEVPTSLSWRSLLESFPFLMAVVTPYVVAYTISPGYQPYLEPAGYWSKSELDEIDPSYLENARQWSYKQGKHANEGK